MSSPFFSIIVIVRDFPHLFPVTMESILQQTCREFEVILIKCNIKKEIEEGYRDQIDYIEVVQENSLSILMNKGIALAKGKFIQFLLPGDYFLSVHILEKIQHEIDEKKPDIIYCSYLERKLDLPPYIQDFPLSKKALTKGQIPTRYQSCWFSRKLLEEFNGYSTKYRLRPNLDFFSKIWRKNTYKIVGLRQVLIDFVVRQKNAAEMLHRAGETFLIIFQNFGFFSAMRWFFAQDLVALIQIVYKHVKGAFWRA